jgi:transcription elongation factor Elf1
MTTRKSRGSRAERKEKAERAALLKEARAEFFKLFTCPFCGYQSCLLGVLSHAVSRHKVNLLAKACRKAPLHQHRRRKGWRATSLRFVTKG